MLDIVGDHDGLFGGLNDNVGFLEGSIDNEGTDEGRKENSGGTGDPEGKEEVHPSPNRVEVSLPPKFPPSSRSSSSYEIL